MSKLLTFGKNKRIHKSDVIKDLIFKGHKYSSDNVNCFFRSSIYKKPRFGIVIGKNIKGSVKRNKIKRCIKEIFRVNQLIFNNFDIIIYVKREFVRYNNEFVKIHLFKIFENKKIFK